MVLQSQELVEAEREVVKMTVEAMKKQEVAIAEAQRDKEVAQLQLEAAKDKADAIIAQKKAEAAVIGFENVAVAAGWKRAVEAFDGNGDDYARYVLYQKLAPGFQSIMTNTADSPFMEVFKQFAQEKKSEDSTDSPDE